MYRVLEGCVVLEGCGVLEDYRGLARLGSNRDDGSWVIDYPIILATFSVCFTSLILHVKKDSGYLNPCHLVPSFPRFMPQATIGVVEGWGAILQEQP